MPYRQQDYALPPTAVMVFTLGLHPFIPASQLHLVDSLFADDASDGFALRKAWENQRLGGRFLVCFYFPEA
jgi:hypothetical protein